MHLSFDQARGALTEAQTLAMWPYFLAGGQRAPCNLYHYTSAAGLLGILTSCSLWASDCRFLNDRSELVYGHNFIKDHLEHRLGPVAAAVLRAEPPTDVKSELYVTSFCEQGDLLSQWRGYSRTQDGYSLGFRFDALAHAKNIILTKVVYNPKEQEEILRGLLARIEDLFIRIDLPEEQTEELIHQAVNTVWALAMSLKDGSFEGEREWRLTAGLDSGYTEQFRVVDGHFVPYVQIPIEAEGLTEIRQGPGAYRSANIAALSRLLSANKFGDTKVVRSLVPL